MKRCSRCGETKAVSEFSQRSASSDGLHYYCRPCHKVLNRGAYKKRKGRPAEPTLVDSMKRCRRCREDKPDTSFHLHSGRSDGRTRICRACFADIRGVESDFKRSGGRDGVADPGRKGLGLAVLAGQWEETAKSDPLRGP